VCEHYARFILHLNRAMSVLVRAYKTYVRPLVEYNSVVWSPVNLHDTDAIESVQRRFTKRLPGLSLSLRCQITAS